MSGALIAATAFLLLCVLAQWWILVRLSDHPRPGALATATAITSAFVTTTALSAALLALIRQAAS